jgi:hypothetical protein
MTQPEATSVLANRHDPIGWLIKRLGVLFLVAVTIALFLLMAPARTRSLDIHQGRVLSKALLPAKL